MIRVKKLNKYFNKGKNNELHVLNDINLEFENNGLVVILGESGSGKTTLLNTIGGLDVFADGEIDYDGETVNRYSPKKIEKIRNDKFGYIFQNYYLLMDNSVEYNVKLALSVYDMTDEEKQERTEYVLDALNMGRYKKKLVSELSGGQQQRVSIARALVKAPSIILADEPTGNLDEENTINTMSLLRNISKECLVIVVSHEKRISKFFADRIIEIQDGQVKKDYKNKATKSYEKADDSNIYLRELSKESMENDDFRINIYKDSRQIKGNADKENSKIISGENISEKIKNVAAQDKENQGNEIKNETDKIVLNFAWKDGKLYIQNLSDTEIAFEGEESGCQMVDDKKPQIDISSVDEIDYSLEKPKAGRTAKLPFREIVKMARENLKLLGKKQAFMIGTLLMVSVLLSVGAADFTNRMSIDKQSVVKSDSHVVTVQLSPVEGVFDDQLNKAAKDFIGKIKQENKYSDIFISANCDMAVKYNGYSQLGGSVAKLSGYSFISNKHLKKSSLICGKMPENRDEAVVDKWVLENFMKSDSAIAPLYKKVDDFIGTTIISPANQIEFKITGVSDTGEPDIFVEENKLLGLSYSAMNLASLDEMKRLYADKKGSRIKSDTKLESGKVLARKSIYNQDKMMGSFLFTDQRYGTFEIAGYFDDDINVDYIANEQDCENIRTTYNAYSKSFDVYTDDVDGAIKYLKKKASAYRKKYFTASVKCQYNNQLNKYREKRKMNVGTKNIVTIALAVLAFIMIYFSIKSNAVSRIEELTVYRLLGIEKGSILQAYVLEMMMLCAYTVLPGALITSSIIKFMAQVPSLQIKMIYPWWAVLLLIIIIFAINIILSILPVNKIISRPPAELAVKD